MNNPAPRVPRLYSVAQVAEHLNICTKKVLGLIRSNTLSAHQIGKQYRISENALLAYLNSTKR